MALLIAFLMVLGCDPKWEISDDFDGDGYSVEDGDCDDLDPSFSPGAEDTWYDGVDSDCAGNDDFDQDGDGVAAIEGDGDDCDDTDPTIYPGAEDAPYDGVFSDCDEAGEYDADGDGVDALDYGGTDCDDTDAQIYPGAAEEWYDGLDSDCAGDDDYDQDGDGARSPLDGGDDCDDTDAQVFPGADEIWYDGADQDCDGNDGDQDGDGYDAEVVGGEDCDDTPLTGPAINPDAEDVWYDGVDSDCAGNSDYDQDGDGHDAADYGGEDCDDLTDLINPDQFEDCGTLVDDNCDGDTNDVNAIGCDTWFADDDGDGYAGSVSRCYCEASGGYVFASADDCDDTDAAISPDAAEVCDPADVDEDCDGLREDDDPDVSSVGMTTFYADDDGDGFGDPLSSGDRCDAGGPYPSTDTSDCDDTRDDIYPGAPETCDDADQDCDTAIDEEPTDAATWYADADGDGYGLLGDALVECDQPDGYGPESGDCDDDPTTGPDIFPGADEVCNELDDNCDGAIDEPGAVDGTVWYTDGDGDDYGLLDDAGETYCEDPGAGFALTNDDCDDANLNVNPGAAEVCDFGDVDQDCDGFADDDDPEGADGAATYYADGDGDGFGDLSDPGADYCDPDAGLVTVEGDCDDTDASINPDAAEICDELGADEDCDGFADDDDPEGADGATDWYIDGDGDGFGEVGSAAESFCDDPGGYARLDNDCDDTDGAINPSAAEVCDASDVDEDCDGFADDDDPEGADGAVVHYPDADLDGFGDALDAGAGYCDPPSDVVTDNTDCDDSLASVNPDASEVCDASDVDEDCDGFADDADLGGATGKVLVYQDLDGDGFGDDTDLGAGYCDPDASLVEDRSDCDDTDSSINPDANEVCDASDVDEDCDGVADDEDSSTLALSMNSWYPDTDLDSYGETGGEQLACEDPDGAAGGWIALDGDCDDTDARRNPGELEVCDDEDLDEDCDEAADDDDLDGADGMVTWYADLDEDGYGDLSDPGTDRCDGAAGEVTNNEDCNDAADAISPDASETCDAIDIDQDCDGFADDDDPEGATGKTLAYTDADEDSFGDAGDLGTTYCDPPGDTVGNNDDCDDTDASINPDAAEVCDVDDVDEDCDGAADSDDPEGADGALDYFVDADGDGFGVGAATSYCDPPASTSLLDGDCDDSTALRAPDLTEVCDDADLDEDCDGFADDADPEGADGALIWYTDADGDDYGDPASSGTLTCETPALSATENTDCDDTEPGINPGAEEIYDNGADEDCDGYDPVGADSAALGDVVIAEIMVDPIAVTDAVGEWFELVNSTGDDIDLKTMVIRDDGTDDFTIEDTVVLPSGARLVFGVSDDSATNGGVPVDVVYDGLNLANGGDELVLEVGGLVLDSRAWTSTADLPPGGQSLSVDDSLVACGAIDAYGDGDLGTPGDSNPDCVQHETDVRHLWDDNCVSCHDGVFQTPDLLTDPYSALVEVIDSGTGLFFVEPYDADQSYIWHKLNGTQATVGGAGAQMPFGEPPLSTGELSLVETWILQGALN